MAKNRKRKKEKRKQDTGKKHRAEPEKIRA